MIRKNILIKKSIKNKSNIRTIGCVGVHQGAGVSQTALLMALYFSEFFSLYTAFIECNETNEFNAFKEMYSWEEAGSNKLSNKDLDIYGYNEFNIIPKLLNENYDKIILDFGTQLDENKDEFLRCDLKIVLCSQAEWKQYFFNKFINNLEAATSYKEWLYFFPYGSKRKIKEIANTYKIKTYSIPFEVDIIRPSKETMIFLKELFI